MTVAVSVAVGSAAQIGIFVVPLLVLISILSSGGAGTILTLCFSTFSTVSLLLAVLLAGALLQVERSHWLGGVFLISLYTLISAGLWVTPDPV